MGLSFSNNFNFADANPGVLDNFNHGTMVTSVIKSLVGSHKGVVNDVDFYTIKVVDDAGGITITSFAAGVNQAITSGLDCLVMPLQFDDATVQSLINSLLDNNCIPFCSAGNASGGSVSTVVSPASKMNAVAVGAVKEDNSYHYTNLLGVTFVCGGYGQNVVNNAGGVQLAYGTSFSAPTAAGIFAGHKEISGLLDNKKVVQKMKNSCKKHEPSLFGYGILQA
ncbi:MAG: S8/S53 family peptidase [Chitinophagaceae bacterium]|nr:S8/S53 family peptidase [Chitinophagaceae bacterium]